MNEQLDTEILGHVALLRFHNPPHNFATVPLMRKLADTLQAVDENPEVRAIVLTSEGKAFCAGADLASPNGFGADSDDPLKEFYDQAIRIFQSRKPVIAAIQGAAVGAGLGLAVASDFRIASHEARFCANFVKLGFHPGFGLTCTLPKLIGARNASHMLLSGKRYKAEEAERLGLVDEMASAEALRQRALQFAEEIAVNAPLALLSTRATLRAGLAEEVQAALAHEHAEQLRLQKTEDFAEGIRAVNERRTGRFTGR